MHNSTLQLGFIGGALDSAVGETHKIACQMDSRWNLCCGAFSTNPHMNMATASKWNIDKSRVYDNWEQLLNDEHDHIDAIAILTPTPSHYKIIKSCLRYNIPIICEKALTSSYHEASEIVDLLDTSKNFLAVTYNYSGYSMIRELQHIIQSGQIGKITQIHIEMPQEGFLRLDKDNNPPKPQEWRLVDHTIPTLSLDLAVHVHQIISFLANEKPLEVVAVNSNYGFFDNIVDNTICLAKYTNNINCNIWFSKTAIGHSNGLKVRIYGNSGSAEWHQMEPEAIKLCDNLGNKNNIERSTANLTIANQERYNRFKPGHPDGFLEAFANYYFDLADCIHSFNNHDYSYSNWVYGVDCALEGLLMLEAMNKSANNKSWVKL